MNNEFYQLALEKNLQDGLEKQGQFDKTLTKSFMKQFTKTSIGTETEGVLLTEDSSSSRKMSKHESSQYTDALHKRLSTRLFV